MNSASTRSPNPAPRPSERKKALRAIDRLGAERRHPSGVYLSFDEFAGLERLDRAELDETDQD